MIAYDAAATCSFESFLSVYRAADAREVFADGRTILTEALTNPSPVERARIASRLLADESPAGFVVDPEHYGALHVLYGSGNFDPPIDANLVRQLIAAGADINLRDRDWGRPLTVFARKFNWPDAVLAPIYDVILARPDLDLHGPDVDGNSLLENAEKARRFRPVLYELLMSYDADHPTGRNAPSA